MHHLKLSEVYVAYGSPLNRITCKFPEVAAKHTQKFLPHPKKTTATKHVHNKRVWLDVSLLFTELYWTSSIWILWIQWTKKTWSKLTSSVQDISERTPDIDRILTPGISGTDLSGKDYLFHVLQVLHKHILGVITTRTFSLRLCRLPCLVIICGYIPRRVQQQHNIK